MGETKVGIPIEKSLIIQNNSGINTRVQIDVKNFKTIQKIDNSDPFIRDPMKNQNIQFWDNFKLMNSTLGVGFVIKNQEFELPAFGLVKFSLIALSEIWGFYEDSLLIKAEGRKHVDSIQLEINIVENPIKLFTTKVVENDEEIAMIRYL